MLKLYRLSNANGQPSELNEEQAWVINNQNNSIRLVNKSFPTFEKIFNNFFLLLNRLSKNQMLTIMIEGYQPFIE